jgi:hypothetical protein
MPTKEAQRSTAWFWLMLTVALYVLVSASLAVATSDSCDGSLHGEKSWNPFPPHWECPVR